MLFCEMSHLALEAQSDRMQYVCFTCACCDTKSPASAFLQALTPLVRCQSVPAQEAAAQTVASDPAAGIVYAVAAASEHDSPGATIVHQMPPKQVIMLWSNRQLKFARCLRSILRQGTLSVRHACRQSSTRSPPEA